MLAVTFKRPFEFIWVRFLPTGRVEFNLNMLLEQQMFCFQLNDNNNNIIIRINTIIIIIIISAIVSEHLVPGIV